MPVSIGARRVGLTAMVIVASLVSGCKKQPPADPATSPPLPSQASNAVPEAASPMAPASSDAQAPAGPRAEVPGEHCALTATLTGPTGANGIGQGTLEIRLEAKDGFHVNELDEVQLQLEGAQSVVRGELARTDATESTADHIKFVVPVQITGAAPSIRGRLRFSVCASVCVRQRLAFQVALH